MLNLIVIYSKDIHALVSFYEILGLMFNKEKHGNGPEHYACVINNLIFEIYPETEKNRCDKATKLGFKIKNLSELLEILNKKFIQYIIKENLIIMKDPDGRSVLLQYD